MYYKKRPAGCPAFFNYGDFDLLFIRDHAPDPHINYLVAIIGIKGSVIIYIYPFKTFICRQGNNDIDIAGFIACYNKRCNKLGCYQAGAGGNR